jgi:hypothetical protein
MTCRPLLTVSGGARPGISTVDYAPREQQLQLLARAPFHAHRPNLDVHHHNAVNQVRPATDDISRYLNILQPVNLALVLDRWCERRAIHRAAHYFRFHSK